MKGRKTFMGKIDVATKQYMSHENVIAEIGEMNTEIKNAIIAADDKTQYDIYAKRLLAQKSILANILVKTVAEFKDMDPSEVEKYIEGEPEIGIIPIEPGVTNVQKTDEQGQRITGFNTENAEINEGMIRFDIVFYVRIPSTDNEENRLLKIIVNVECQKDEPTAYSILNRAIFYASRLISSQKERDFANSNYDDIKQVFSIWVCMNMKYNSMTHIHLTKDETLKPYEWKGNLDLLNIVMIGITNELPEKDERYELHRLICALLSNQVQGNQKFDILEKEYNIPTNTELREDVSVMCNLSLGIEERAEARGENKKSEKVVMNMYKKGYTTEQIMDIVELGEEEIKDIIKANLQAVK